MTLSMEDDDVEIPIWIGGCEKWLTGLTRRTTCDDVIYALLMHDYDVNQGRTWDVQNYAVFESWRGVERPLNGRAKILKIYRTWGLEIQNVRFCLRKLDNMLDSSSEISRRARKHRKSRMTDLKCSCGEKDSKSREKTRDAKKRSSARDTDHHRLKPEHKYGKRHPWGYERMIYSKGQGRAGKSKMFHHLVQLVIEQERWIQEQLSQIKKMDSQIAKAESRVQDVSTRQEVESSTQQALFPHVKSHDMEAYLHMCESIVEMQEKIASEHSKIEDLSFQIQEESILECDESEPIIGGEYSITSGICTVTARQVDTSVNGDSLNESSSSECEMGVLKNELQRCISLSRAQQYQMQLVNQTLGECEKQLLSKSDYISRLATQLYTIEEEPEEEEEEVEDYINDSGNVDLPPVTATEDPKGGRDSCDSGVQSDITIADPMKSTNTQIRLVRFDDATLTSLPAVRTRVKPDLITEASEIASKSSGSRLHMAALPRLRRHMVPYKTYSSGVVQHDFWDQYSVSNSKSPQSDDSDTGLSSLHSDDPLPILETLV